MNTARKVEAILDAWLDYIALDDYSKARIKANSDKVKQRGVQLVNNHVLIEQPTFSELQQKVTQGQKNQPDQPWVLSFPQITDVDKGQTYLCPLFSLDITSLLKGEYKAQGWNLDELRLIEAGDNLATFLKLDDEQREKLITQDGLRRFLETTFEQEFETYQEWMQRVNIRRNIHPQPYLFEFTGTGISRNLKQDLKDIKKDIKSRSKNWLTPGHPAHEYLFGVPQPVKHEVTYMGAFPTHAPTNSQLQALKHAQTEPMTAVQGPPGSGKTTLILHLIAQQVVKRALSLIATGEDINNMTFVSSTNNKAVDNVIEKLDDWLKKESLRHEFLYLKGGNKNNITSSGGAIEQLQQALDYLQKNSFDESYFQTLKQQITLIKDDLIAQESHYLGQRGRRALDEERLPQLLKKIQTLRQELDAAIAARGNFQQRANDLANYEQLPIEDYQKIQLRFDNAERQLPEGVLPWWVRLWHWLTRKTEKQIITKAVLACESAIENTLNTPFPVANPRNRTDLIQQLSLVRERLDKAQELTDVQGRLRQIGENIVNTERERYEISSELNAVENRLTTQLTDFYSCFHQNLHDKHKELFQLSREFLAQQALCNKELVQDSLKQYSNFLLENGRNKYKIADKMAENLNEHTKALSLMFPVITCTLLSIRNMLPWANECVDRTIVDEAGMIDLHKTFPLLVRSRKAIIVGDPLQIEPIISLSDSRRDDYRQTAFLDRGLTENDYHRYSPEEEYSATTYHRAAGANQEDNDNGQGICLIEHYRCQQSIIQYCNKIANYGLEVKTEPVTSLLESNLIAYHVEGNIKGNVNEEEVTAVCELIQHLINQGYSLKDIGVISPFNVHAAALRERLTKKFSNLGDKSIGTIHTFQGSEKKVIILSTKVCRPQDNVSWMNRRPNLLNVAVSRAKELFILVGNLYRLEKAGSYTRQLVEHIQESGLILEYKSEEEIPQQQTGNVLLYDCDHLNIFREALENAEEELMIVTPWIRGNESKRFVDDIVSSLEKGVKVTVVYGNKGSEENDSNDASTEQELKELFSQYPGSRLIRLGRKIHIESRGTNEKILVCDTKFAIVGSWNWLSHPYRKQCSRSLINPKVQIRRETSIQLSDSSSIEEVKARISQLLTQ